MGLSGTCLRRNQNADESLEIYEKILIKKPVLLGIGNPGIKYELTRHNIGKLFLDYVSKALSLKWQSFSLYDIIETDEFILIKSNAYMNVSSTCLMEFSEKFTQENISNLIVVCDLLEKNIGNVYLKKGGSDKGNYGLRSVYTFAKDNDFSADEMNKLFLGIGKPETLDTKEVADWILGRWNNQEKESLEKETFPKAWNMFQRKILKYNIEKFNQNSDIKFNKRPNIKVLINENQNDQDKNITNNTNQIAPIKQKNIKYMEKISKQILKDTNDLAEKITLPEETVFLQEINLLNVKKITNESSSIDSNYFQMLEMAKPSPKLKNMSYTASQPVLHMSPKVSKADVLNDKSILNSHKKSLTKEEKYIKSTCDLQSKINVKETDEKFSSKNLDELFIDEGDDTLETAEFANQNNDKQDQSSIDQQVQNNNEQQNQNDNYLDIPKKKVFDKKSPGFSTKTKSDLNRYCGHIDQWLEKDSEDSDATLKYNDWRQDQNNKQQAHIADSLNKNFDYDNINMVRKNISPRQTSPNRRNGREFGVDCSNNWQYQKNNSSKKNRRESTGKKNHFYHGSSPTKNAYTNHDEYERKHN